MDEEVIKALLFSTPTIPVEALTRVFPIGRNAAYEMVRKGQVETIPAGKRKLVLTAPLRRRLGLEVA